MAENVKAEYAEKRQVERKYLVFYLRVFDGISSNVIGHVVNLSSKGILLLSDKEIPLNQEYRLRMKIPTEVCEQGQLMLGATSRWSQPDANPDFFMTGFKLHDLTTTGKNEILCLLDKFSYLP